MQNASGGKVCGMAALPKNEKTPKRTFAWAFVPAIPSGLSRKPLYLGLSIYQASRSSVNALKGPAG